MHVRFHKLAQTQAPAVLLCEANVALFHNQFSRWTIFIQHKLKIKNAWHDGLNNGYHLNM